jgi:hypothetical protein
MGYYIKPQAYGSEAQEIIKEAAMVFVKAHAMPTDGLVMEVNLKRRIVKVSDPVSGLSMTYTFAELGFL